MAKPGELLNNEQLDEAAQALSEAMEKAKAQGATRFELQSVWPGVYRVHSLRVDDPPRAPQYAA